VVRWRSFWRSIVGQVFTFPCRFEKPVSPQFCYAPAWALPRVGRGNSSLPDAAKLGQPENPRANIIPCCTLVLTSTLLSLFALDGVAKPLK
jgi:hypothetical protein